jgi:uncharacterized protein YunC (DUF1805 family)
MTSKGVDDGDLQPELVVDAGERGRIFVGNSLTSFDHGDFLGDVLLGASFAGGPTGAIPLRQGAKGWIAHEAGPGKDEAGIAGLPLSDRFGVPAAAIATMEARLSAGSTLLSGRVSRVNESSRSIGVRVGMTGREAALAMLASDISGTRHDVSGLIDEDTVVVEDGADGRIVACWSFSRVKQTTSRDVFCVASHGARLMALYALRVRPKGLVCNDAGRGLDDAGIEGLAMLDPHDIAAATVSTDSARIGDPLSTYEDGVLSAVNRSAVAIGLETGMSAKDAVHLMLRRRAAEHQP